MNTAHFPYPKSPKGRPKQEFLHFTLQFFISSLKVIVDTSNLVCGLTIAKLLVCMVKGSITSIITTAIAITLIGKQKPLLAFEIALFTPETSFDKS